MKDACSFFIEFVLSVVCFWFKYFSSINISSRVLISGGIGGLRVNERYKYECRSLALMLAVKI